MNPRRTYRYTVVDVFTRVPLEGNPLAVFPEAAGITDAEMQKIARELNLSETVFIEEPTLAECVKSFRIFTPAREMIFAGHPTVGAAHVLLTHGLVPKGVDRFFVQEKIGPVAVRVEMADAPLLWLETPSIEFEAAFEARACANALGLPISDLLPVEPQLLNAGNPTLFVAVRDKRSVDSAALDPAQLASLKMQSKPFCVFVFTPTTEGAYSRMFAPDYGIPEDPATGSSTGPLAAYMKGNHLLPRGGSGRFVSEQGTSMGRRSLLHFEIETGTNSETVLVGGHVTPVIEAVLTL